MTITELKQRHKRYWVLTYTSLTVGIAVIYSGSNKACIEFAAQYLGKEVFSFSALVFGLLLTAGGIILSGRLHIPKCPSCKRALSPKHLGVVIATKNCASCGENVIS